MDAMDTDAPTPATHAPTRDPWEYQAWTRSLLRKLLAADGDARLELARALTHAYAATLDVMALRPLDWHLYLSVAMYTRELDLAELVALHERSTRDSADVSLAARYASLLLGLYAQAHGKTMVLPTHAVFRAPDGAAWDVAAAVEAWTRLEPHMHANGMYTQAALSAPAPPAALVQEDAMRAALRALYTRLAWHPHESQAIWDMYVALELQLAQVRRDLTQDDASEERLELVRQVYVARLHIPHEQLETTFQQFSQLISERWPADAYETVLASANKHYAEAMRVWREHERHEDSVKASCTESAWRAYLGWQTHRLKQLRVAKDKSALAAEEAFGAMLYRRALLHLGTYPTARNAAEAAAYYDQPPTEELEAHWQQRQRRQSQKAKTTQQQRARVEARPAAAAAESLWLDYTALLQGPHEEADAVLDACLAATRALPVSGRLAAQYMRALTRFQRPAAQVRDVYASYAQDGSLAAVSGGAALLAVLQAHIDCERALATHEIALARRVPPEEVSLSDDVDQFMRIYELLVGALSAMHALPDDEQDAGLTLELYATDWIERAAAALSRSAGAEAAEGLLSLADDLWAAALKKHGMNAHAYTAAADYYKRRGLDKRARQTFKGGAAKPGLENRAVVLQAWAAFEHLRGSPADIEHAEAKAKVENDKLWRAWYEYQQRETAPPAPAAEAPAASTDAQPMDTDAPEAPKRKADDSAPADKKRADATESPASRDREFASVMVSGLPADATASDVRRFFKDCGTIFEVVGPRVVHEQGEEHPSSAAQVEFTDREGAGAARTRDWKRVGGEAVHVSLSYTCTLYITNFPPDATDQMIRERFSRYGAIFDVRWPSRRFVQSRRFCYLQYTQAASAQAALAEHNSHWHGDHPLQVLLSNPQHKKQRTDANANDKELYITGLPRAATEDDVRAFIAPHGTVTAVRMPARPDGKSRGIAFVELASALEARRAMQATNSTKLLGRLVAVMLAEAGRGVRVPQPSSESAEDRRARTILVAGLPADAQEPLIQQAVELAVGAGTVRRVLWTPGRAPGLDGLYDSLVELSDAETAGKAVLAAHATYGTMPLRLSEQPAPHAAAHAPRGMSRGAMGGRGRGARRGAFGFARVHAGDVDATPKDQDEFRNMLRG